MLLWIDACVFKLAIDGMLAAVDALVLVVHDRASANCGVLTQIPCKTWDGRNDEDHAEFAVFFAGSDTGVDDCAADSVVDGRLLFTSSGDEELIFNVDIMLGVLDHFSVRVLNAVVEKDSATPVVTASNNLRMDSACVL